MDDEEVNDGLRIANCPSCGKQTRQRRTRSPPEIDFHLYRYYICEECKKFVRVRKVRKK